MLFFENDYGHGAHPAVLRRLWETNLVPQPGYGEDAYSESARRLLRAACGAPGAEIFFLAGGTQVNAVAIGGLLRPWEGVYAASTGHINAHEAGAVEYTGHKVLPLPSRRGKLDPEDLRRGLEDFYADPNHEHMVFPGMVYLSHPSEYGTLYTLGELEKLSDICKSYHIPLYLDGARLAYALAADEAVTLPDIARLCDVFTVGGTKCGALCGEALVFPRGAPAHFLTLVKQRGALLAKGRLCGVQFQALFEDGLYFEIGKTGVEMAARLKEGLLGRGFRLFEDSPTNQQFPVVPNALLPELSKRAAYSFWETRGPDESVIRLAASWATKPEDVEELLKVLDNIALGG